MPISAMRFNLLLCVAAVAAAQESPLAQLRSGIQRLTRSANASWGIYIKCLETEEEIAINADQQMDTMSVIKIPLMVEAFRQIDAGRFSLTDRISLTEERKTAG